LAREVCDGTRHRFVTARRHDHRAQVNVFECYLSLRVALCMVVGVVLGLTASGLMQGMRTLEFGAGSQINVQGVLIRAT